jgi:Tol biopolymer transport system component
MSDLKVELEELKEEAESGRLQVVPAVGKRVSPFRLAVVAVAVIALIAAGWYWLNRQRSAEPEEPLIPVPLTSYPGWEDSPSFSPDGTQVAFERRTEEPGSTRDIWIKQIGVEPPARLTTDPAEDWSPAWSPDGNFIAFLRMLSPNKAAVLIIPQRGGQERVLTETALTDLDESCLAWTPDSKWLAYRDMEGPGLFLLSVQTGEKRRLTDGDDAAPDFSPDGRTLAFSRHGQTISLLRLLEGYTGKEAHERLHWVGQRHVGLAWTPDGSEIIFSYGTFRSSGLWRITASASAVPQRLPFASENSCHPAVPRHGNRLAYALWRHDSNIWRVDLGQPDLKPGTPLPLISSTRVDACPAYSPDGTRIAFFSNRSGAYELWVCNGDGSNPAQLTTCGGVTNGPRWSPDGRTIAFTVEEQRYQYVYVIGANGGIPRRLTSDPTIHDKWPSWSQDGRWVYFDSWRDGDNQIWKVSAGGGKAVRITPKGVMRAMPQESADGKFLCYYRESEERG